MNKQDITQGVTQFIKMAFVDNQNVGTGFLTRHCANKMTKDQIREISSETEMIINNLAYQLEQGTAMNGISDIECATLFQYIFDKVTEVVYKSLVYDEVDTIFDLNEAFDYYEPDLPEYIQLKLTNEVGKIAIINKEILDYLDKHNARTNALSLWLPPYLMVAAIIAIQFALEIDLEDESEMQDYMKY